MRKILSSLLVLCLLFTLMAGCSPAAEQPQTPSGSNDAPAAEQGGNDAPAPAASGEEKTVRFWAHQNNAWNAVEQKMIDGFVAENPGVKVEFEAFPYGDFESKTQTSLLSQSGGADVYLLWGGWAIDFAKTGAFAPMPDSLISTLKADCYEPVLGAFEYEGKYYGAPVEFNHEFGGMLALKPWFDENGISYPTTWDEMINIATEHSESEGEIFNMRGFDFVTWDNVPYTYLMMILSSGGDYITADGGFDFNTPVAIECLDTLASYITDNKVTTIAHLTGGGDEEAPHWLAVGEALMVPRGSWIVADMEVDYELTYGVDFEYIAMPFYGPQKRWAAETGWGLAVTSNTSVPDEAWGLVEYFMRPENLVQINIECRMVPPLKSVAHDPAILEAMPFMAPVLDVLDAAEFIGYINTDVLKEGIINAYIDVVQNGTPASEAVLSINKFIEENA